MPPGMIPGLCLAGLILLLRGGGGKTESGSGTRMTDQELVQEAQRRGLTK